MSPDRSPFWHHFLRPESDFLALLAKQLDLAETAVEAFVRWCDNRSQDVVDEVYQLEKDADAVRVALVNALNDAFETPFDREDVDDLSRSIDDIVDGVRHAMREAVALGIAPDAPLREMLGNVKSGVIFLRQSVQGFRGDRKQSLRQAGEARHIRRINERVYTHAMSHLLDADNDFKTVLRQREGYRQLMDLSCVLEGASEHVQHALNKLG